MGKDLTIEQLVFDDKNFNKHTEQGMGLLEKSLQELGAGRSILVDKNNNIISGNGIAEAAGRVGIKKVRVIEVQGDELVAVRRTDMELDSEKGRKMALADNATAAVDLSWDYDTLQTVADEFDIDTEEWGVELPKNVEDWLEEDEEQEQGNENEKYPDVEKLLDDAMRVNIRECLEQLELLKQRGWITSGLTQGACEGKFIRAKYYGDRYPQWMNTYFAPKIFETSANNISVYEQMLRCNKGEKAGIAGFRTLTKDGTLFPKLLSTSYPIGGARKPLDFPSNVARSIYDEFSPQTDAPDCLDPCHGWGGRLVGALLADVKSYTGIGPSPVAHEGVTRISQAFGKYSPNTKVELIKQPFERVELKEESYDIALTSPPYFDVEQYDGDEQAHRLYPKYDLWREGFYIPLICNTYKALRKGGVFVLQVGSQSYPLREDGIKIAESCGFVVEDIRPLGGSTNSALHGNQDNDETNEKIIILRK